RSLSHPPETRGHAPGRPLGVSWWQDPARGEAGGGAPARGAGGARRRSGGRRADRDSHLGLFGENRADPLLPLRRAGPALPAGEAGNALGRGSDVAWLPVPSRRPPAPGLARASRAGDDTLTATSPPAYDADPVSPTIPYWRTVTMLNALRTFLLAAAAAATLAVPAFAQAPIKIGVLPPLSPPGDAAAGQFIVRGAKRAAGEINGDG